MYKMRLRKDGSGNIIIAASSFKHLLNCLDNQKFIYPSMVPPCGDAIAMGKEAFDAVNAEIQAAIDDCNSQCRSFMAG